MSSEKRKSPSTFRSIATLQTLARNAKPRERHQIANRFACLENERARLERETSIWVTRLEATEKKLAKVREEIDLLKPLLEETPAKAVCRSGRGQRRACGLTETQERSPAAKRTMQLSY